MNKKGGASIFVLMIFSSLLLIIFLFISAAKGTAVEGVSGELGYLWAGSVMAEYDKNLLEKYNIFGYYSYVPEVIEKIEFYAESSFDDKKYVDFSDTDISQSTYSLAEVSVIKKQIVEVGKFITTDKIVNRILPSETAEEEKSENINQNSYNPEIKNKNVLLNLPSAGSSGGLSTSNFVDAVQNAGSLNGIVKEGTTIYFENLYIMDYFKNLRNSNNLGKTFFNDELEYIIAGKTSDMANVRAVKRRIIGAREILNFLYLLSDSKKSEEAMVLALVIAPKLAEPMQKIILLAWAYLESENDYKLLISGKKVPFFKDDASWATDLESISTHGFSDRLDDYLLSDGTEEEIDAKQSKLEASDLVMTGPMIDPGNENGQTYEDYIKAMLYLMDENDKMLRVMDLIQINMQYCYYRNFLLSDYNGGIDMNLEVNGKEYAIKKKY